MPEHIANIGPHLGKVVLVGISFVDEDGFELEQRQYWGTILGQNADRWIEIEVHGKNKYGDHDVLEIPPMLEAAAPGEYRLHSTGELIANPDFTTQWEMYAPAYNAFPSL